MNITCASCSARYAVPDDKVQGRKVRIKCKKCSSPIIIDGTKGTAEGARVSLVPSETTGGAPAAAPRQTAKKTIVGGLEAPAPAPARTEAKKTILGGVGVAQPAAISPRPAAAAPAPSPAVAAASAGAAKGTLLGGMVPAAGSAPAPPEDLWTVAVTEDDQREVSAAEVANLYAAGIVDSETFIWKEGMDDWLTPFEIPEIAAKLAAKGIRPPDEEATVVGRSPLDDAPPSGGAWHEPGSWEPPAAAGPGQGVGFDDVTVAMAAPDAAMLARAAGDDHGRDLAAAPGLEPGQEESTVAISSPLGAPEPARPSPAPRFRAPSPTPAPAAKLPFELDVPPQSAPEPELPRPGAARRDGGRPAEAKDLFGGIDEPSQDPRGAHYTGERNENSVLFSLDALSKMQGAPGPAKVERAPEALLLSSGPVAEDGPPESIANLAAGGLFSPSMAAPDFTAPVAEPPPPSDPVPSAVVAKPSSGSGILPIALVALLLLGVGGGTFAYLKWPKADPAGSDAPPPTAEPLATTEPVETSTATASAEPAAPAAPSASAAEPPAEEEKKKEEPEEKKEEEKKKDDDKKKEEEKKKEEPEEKKEEEKKEEPKVEAPPSDLPPFDRAAASAALGSAAGSAAGCKQPDGPTGSGRAAVTFMPSGRATNAVITGDFAGTAVGGCVARIFRAAKVPPFSGDAVTVGKSFSIQ